MQRRLLTILLLGSLWLLLTVSLLALSQSRFDGVPLPTLAQLPTVTDPPVSSSSPTPGQVTLSPAAVIRPAFTSTAAQPPAITRTQSAGLLPSPTMTASATITETTRPVVLLPLEIDFDRIYAVSLEFRQPIRAVLEANHPLLPDSRLTVSAYRDTGGWAKITLVPTALVEQRWPLVGTLTPVEIIARETAPREWAAYLTGSPAFETISADIPPTFVDYGSPLPPLEGEYRFPWQNTQSWWAIQGWHQGNALDFQPGIGARFGVLAAQAGYLREICSDGYQSLLEIRHADGHSTYYLHVRLALSTRNQLLDQPVRRGQYLGELIEQQRFVTACGQGNSRHLHFAVSDRTLSIEGYALEAIAASASCCVNPPSYRSANVRVNTRAASP